MLEEGGGEEERVRAINRAVRYEEKVMQKHEGCWVKLCVKWNTEKRKVNIGKWRETKRKALGEMGWSEEEMERMRIEGREVGGFLKQRISDIERQNRQMKIRDSKYNMDYKVIRPKDGIAEYLTKHKLTKIELQTLARFRVGSYVKACEYWREGEKVCRICREEEETVKHLIKHFKDIVQIEGKTKIDRQWYKILDEKGEGVRELKKIVEFVENSMADRSG